MENNFQSDKRKDGVVEEVGCKKLIGIGLQSASKSLAKMRPTTTYPVTSSVKSALQLKECFVRLPRLNLPSNEKGFTNNLSQQKLKLLDKGPCFVPLIRIIPSVSHGFPFPTSERYNCETGRKLEKKIRANLMKGPPKPINLVVNPLFHKLNKSSSEGLGITKCGSIVCSRKFQKKSDGTIAEPCGHRFCRCHLEAALISQRISGELVNFPKILGFCPVCKIQVEDRSGNIGPVGRMGCPKCSYTFPADQRGLFNRHFKEQHSEKIKCKNAPSCKAKFVKAKEKILHEKKCITVSMRAKMLLQ